jgi:asparagine synthase (glutamine-hydrolysing)
MCGIAGCTGRHPELLQRMLDSIVHRGPDGSGTEVNDQISIGIRRLAVVDIETGQQPLYDAEKSLALVVNGEIYNAPALRRELEGRGHVFATDHSDSEVILHGYVEWGTDVVSHLVGMFAFALWDSERQHLFLARDRLGIKPLYYTSRNGTVLFASEIKAILQDESVPRRADPDVLHRFLLYRVHDADERTFFEGIKRLLPGHTMTVTPDGTVTTERYWNPALNLEFTGSLSDDEYADEFAARYEAVMRRHLLSDVSVGVPLSGGLDSSGVACTLARLMADGGVDLHTDGDLHTFSALYPGQWLDESAYVHEVERRVGSRPHYAYPKVDEFWDEVMTWMWFQEEPTIASAPYAYYCVYRIAKEHVTVMLSGNGGDELLAGYIPYFRTYLTSARRQGHLVAGARELVMGWDLYQRYFLEAARQRLPFGSKPFGPRPFLRASSGELDRVHYAASPNLNQRLADDVLKFSTPNLLRYEDKNSMAFSIEARVPFLDHELVEFIFGLPIDQKIDGGWNRAVYRRALKGKIPEKIRRRRKKIGFSNPEEIWLRARAAKIREIFDSSVSRDRGIYDCDALVATFDRWLAGAPGDAMAFWRFLVSELWMRRFLDEPVAIAS